MASVNIQPLRLTKITVPVRGTTPLIVHRFSKKSQEQMLEGQTGKAKKGRTARDPHQDYLDSMYELPEGRHAFPGLAFKAAAVRAAKGLGMPMTDARNAFFIDCEGPGQLITIEGEPRMRQDVVRLQGNKTDLRFRAEYPEWSANLNITFNEALISEEQVVNLINAGGFGVGVGEWRPEKNGQFGRFEVATTE